MLSCAVITDTYNKTKLYFVLTLLDLFALHEL